MKRRRAGLLAVVCAAGCVAAAADVQVVHRDVYLMGTRARLVVVAADQAAGAAVLERALRVLERTERELTTWNDRSEISRLNLTPVGTPWTASPELCAMFDRLFAWHAVTRGTFDPGIGQLTRAWGIHDGGRVPRADEIASVLRRSGLERIAFARDTCRLTRGHDVLIDVGAFGKGEALDRVGNELPGTPWMIDLGGQVSVGAPHPVEGDWTIDVAHPVERDRALLQVRIRRGSLSTSGGSERDIDVDGARVGHILDPRTGKPAAFRGSVVVWHESGLAADVLSTALYVMGPQDGLSWARDQRLAAAYLVPEGSGVRRLMTGEFSRLVATP